MKGDKNMDFEELRYIKDDTEQVTKLYKILNEDTRLNSSKAGRVEFLTNVKYIEDYLKQGDRILDIGAGAGEYSLYFAEKGYDVSAVELSEDNIKAFKKKITPEHPIDLKQGNALDLSTYEDNSFDIVLLFGPLYHLHKEEDRQKAIEEAKRVCKDDGTLFFAFISNDMVVLTELCYNSNFFKGDTYDHKTFKVEDYPFVFFTLDQCRKILKDGGIDVTKEIASDGVSELLQDKINNLDDESYKQYLRFHFYTCDKPEMLGYSNHLLFIGRKQK